MGTRESQQSTATGKDRQDDAEESDPIVDRAKRIMTSENFRPVDEVRSR